MQKRRISAVAVMAGLLVIGLGLLAAPARAQTGEASSGSRQPSATVAPVAQVAPPAKPKTYSTPQEVLAAAQKARDAKDWSTWADCLAPEAQKAAVEFSIAMELMESGAPDAATDKAAQTPQQTPEQKKQDAALKAFFTKYKVTDQKRNPGEDDKAFAERLAETVKDKRAFIIELMGLTEEPPQLKPQLSDLKIAGDTATGKLVTRDPDASTASVDIEFKKVDGSWRVTSVLDI